MLGRSTFCISKVSPLCFQFMKSTKTLAANPLCSRTDTTVICPTLSNVYQTRYYSQQNPEALPTVDYDHVKKVTKSDDAYIIDVREPDEIKEHGKIPNSCNIPLSNIATILSASPKEFKDMFNREKPNENSELIFYCMIGKRSGMAQQNAVQLGYTNTKNYLGSWTDWAVKNQ